MQAYNFSRLDFREKRVYSIGDVNLSSTGLATKMLIIIGTLEGISIVLNCMVAALINNWYFNPFQGTDLNIWPLVFILGIPAGLGAMLWFVKIDKYRLYEFLWLYFRPKHTYALDGTKTCYSKISINAFLENKQHSGEVVRAKATKQLEKKQKKGK